ncbi:MAG: KEOPS complex N(6)-L-threonylcarbamoyladenine synthase Kae1 [Nitrososphaerota archaeon]
MRREGTICLGIESTAHTFGVGIVSSNGEILANENDIYRPRSGGIHPREAAQHHASVAHHVLRRAISRAGVNLGEVDVIAFSYGPGLGPCLRTGATIARALALKLRRPLVAVNHGVAHIVIGKLTTGFKDPVVLYVAGGNTLVTTLHEKRYRLLGETLDIAAGNCLDVFGIKAGIGPMPAPEEYAKLGKVFYPLPLHVKGMDVSFSGLLTSAEKLLEAGKAVPDIALSLTETIYAMLTEVLERALALTQKKEVLLVGGLARSRRLQQMITEMVKIHGAEFKPIPDQFLGDNGAMIAWNGLKMFLSGHETSIERSFVKPRLRLDETEVTWD